MSLNWGRNDLVVQKSNELKEDFYEKKKLKKEYFSFI